MHAIELPREASPEPWPQASGPLSCLAGKETKHSVRRRSRHCLASIRLLCIRRITVADRTGISPASLFTRLNDEEEPRLRGRRDCPSQNSAKPQSPLSLARCGETGYESEGTTEASADPRRL